MRASCGGPFTTLRPDTEYCSARCRRTMWKERAHEGRIYSVRKTVSGEVSIVIRFKQDIGVLPGEVRRLG